MLLSLTGFESSKTVQIRIYNVTTSTEVVAWTATGVSDANKDAVDKIIITIVNADANNTFYIDNMFGDTIGGNFFLMF